MPSVLPGTSMPPFQPGPVPPLCVDLDGTLIRGDTLVLSLRGLLVRQPWQAIPLALALLDGRAGFKAAVARRWIPAAQSLPYRRDVVEFVREEHRSGRFVILATAAHQQIADAVAGHLGIFSAVIASDARQNFKGADKVAAIRALIGPGEFDYMGDSRADLPVFAAARLSHLVAPSPDVLAQAKQQARIGRIFPD